MSYLAWLGYIPLHLPTLSSCYLQWIRPETQEVIQSRDGDLSCCALWWWLCLWLLAFHWCLHITRELLPNGNDSTLYQTERWRVLLPSLTAGRRVAMLLLHFRKRITLLHTRAVQNVEPNPVRTCTERCLRAARAMMSVSFLSLLSAFILKALLGSSPSWAETGGLKSATQQYTGPRHPV